MIIPNQRQALEQIKPHGYPDGSPAMRTREGAPGIKATRFARESKKPVPIAPSGNAAGGILTAFGTSGAHSTGV